MSSSFYNKCSSIGTFGIHQTEVIPENHGEFFSKLLSVCLLTSVCFLWVASSGAAEPDSSATINLETSQDFIVSTNEGLVSVKATDSPFKEVIEKIGQALDIEVEARIGDEEKVTAEFQDLPLDQAMRRLSENYAYISDGEKPTKLFILPKGGTVPENKSMTDKKENEPSRSASKGEPFKFEYDPRAFIR